ncbi:DUF2721 domain-containing protein [Tunicatimonas pelagia]|uniref:DUF2721 domain-containing protein n=1 Tax=Tunicatimonas pelagia TaxID=931531 RepID=UPI002665D85A|nr:DUF2721 domain-containing protein [Tunicatimonas pelagia]WKN42917.1 DUF2721 domain-containing protein [Tunicatimonas pelagia]
MNELTLTTPALLFPAISLLLLAYTNRFLAIAALIRQLHSQYSENHDGRVRGQIENLRKRVILTRNMQSLGIMSLFLCVLCMFLLFAEEYEIGKWVFGISLLLLLASLGLSVREIQISTNALGLQLSDMESNEQLIGDN